MSRMVIDDEAWFRLEKLLPKPKGRHGKDDRWFMMFGLMNIVFFFGVSLANLYALHRTFDCPHVDRHQAR
ncbi:hypothetical protein [Fluoribacter gormanii]|uniref:hypothetical protein n=1 Tax=Fluoribacter gormanii TaxID=464 RepID=UPI0013EF98A6|nr:hypothetical protein [Fluoribacter gormanii]